MAASSRTTSTRPTVAPVNWPGSSRYVIGVAVVVEVAVGLGLGVMSYTDPEAHSTPSRFRASQRTAKVLRGLAPVQDALLHTADGKTDDGADDGPANKADEQGKRLEGIHYRPQFRRTATPTTATGTKKPTPRISSRDAPVTPVDLTKNEEDDMMRTSLYVVKYAKVREFRRGGGTPEPFKSGTRYAARAVTSSSGQSERTRTWTSWE